MTDEPLATTTPSPPARRSRSRVIQRWIAAVLVGVLLVVAGAAMWLDSRQGHRFIAGRIERLAPQSGLRIKVGRIEGSIYSKATLRDVRIADPQGEFLYIPQLSLDWFPFAWINNRLDVDRLIVPTANLHRLPKLRPSPTKGPILPDFDIHIMELRVSRLVIDKAITGREQVAVLRGKADIRSGRAIVDFDARTLDGSDALLIKLDSRPDDDRFDISAAASMPKNGVIGQMLGLRQDANLSIEGDGSWSRWTGRLIATLDRQPAAILSLQAKSGDYSIEGTVEPSHVAVGGLIKRLGAPRIMVKGQGTFKDKVLDGTLSLASSAIALDAHGAIDLAGGAFDNLGLDISLRQPGVLLKNVRGKGVVARIRLDGAFSTARYEYLAAADAIAFGKTAISRLFAKGNGRLGGSGPLVVPISVRAPAVIGNGVLVDGILRNLAVDGVLQVKGDTVTSNKMTIRSDRLNGQIIILGDLGTGRYDVGLIGTLNGLEIPHLGIVDIRSDIHAVPGVGGAFTLKGKAAATMRRLDNGFLRGLAGGLPRLESDIALLPDGRLIFSRLTLNAPDLTLKAEGYRRPDDIYHFAGNGTHRKYGPLTLTLDGRIDRPTVDVILARPLDAAGLRNVHARLVPSAAGYEVDADGQSTLGPFKGKAVILLPAGGDAVIDVTELRVAATVARGRITPLANGLLQGSLAIGGTGLTGSVRLEPVGTIQRIAVDLDAARASFPGPPPLQIAQGKLTANILLDPRGTTVDATLQARGIQSGTMRLGRLAANARLIDGRGRVTASVAGQRGRLFDLQVMGDVQPRQIRLSANGTLDRRSLSIASGGLLQQTEDGWRLSPTTIAYGGGRVQLAGIAGGETVEVEARLNALPLTLLDLVNSQIGLGGAATGSISFAWPRAGLPTGKAELRVANLTRSGLTLSSAPIDLGLNAELTRDRLAARAVAATGGQTIGQAQLLLTPLGQGDLVTRLSNAPLVAQLRYNGRADTLWRLTNVEIIDLSGPVTVTADARGTLTNPEISGNVAADDIRLESPVTGMVLTGVKARGIFGGSKLVLSSVSGTTKGGGTVSGSGTFDLSAARGVGIDLKVQANAATLLDRDDIGATITGPLSIQSTGDGGVISGEVELVRSRFALGRAAAVAAIPELRLIEKNRSDDDFAPVAPSKPWRLDLKANARNRLTVTGLGIDSEWRANLQIGGTVTDPALRGTAELIRGGYEFAGRRFDLRSGEIRFDGSVPANPTLDIEAVADVSGLSATIRVQGSSDKPQISFSSIPSMPEDELLSRLLFGTSITNLSAPEALQLAGAVGSLRGGKGGLDPINAVRKAAGLDRLRILPADPQTGQGTSLAAGKYLTRRIYVELITDGQGYSATRVEYQISRWLTLLGSISSIGRQSINLRASKDY